MEYIIKYTGDILSLGYPTELLDAQFAIMELLEAQAGRLLEHQQVTCFEPARNLSSLADRSMEAACIPPVQRKSGLGLTGEGVLIGFVDSGLDLNHPEFMGEDGTSRVIALWDMTAEGTPPEGFTLTKAPGRRFSNSLTSLIFPELPFPAATRFMRRTGRISGS